MTFLPFHFSLSCPAAQLMETWDAQLLVRCADDLEAIMKSASGDSSAEGRTVRTYGIDFCILCWQLLAVD